MTDEGELLLEEYEKLFTERTKLVSVTQVSNVLGTINPVKEMIRIAHEHGVPVVVDGAQSVPHFAVDVQDLDCDFLAFSGHKVYGRQVWAFFMVKKSGSIDYLHIKVVVR